MLALLLAAQIAATPAPTATIDQLAWLQGCWLQARPNGSVEELWMAPGGGVMLGLGRTIRDGRLRDFEYVRIETRQSSLAYVARPSGQAEAVFPLKSLTDSEAVFEDLAHDFPQRVIYRRLGPDAVTGRIEGEVNGKAHSVDFPYTRCPAK
jgi:hypothetical protein